MSAIVLTQSEIEELIDKRIALALAEVKSDTTNKPILNTQEVAALLGKHPKTIRKLVLERGLPVNKESGREPRFVRDDVMAWLKKGP